MSPEDRRRPAPATRWWWMLGGSFALAGLSLLVLPRSVAYDPWSWLIWGREITHLDLNTRAAATAVKPLPIAFTTLFARTGVAPILWLVVARAAALLSFAVTFQLARRYAGVWAGLVAAVCLASADQYLGYLFMRGMSEPMATAAVLAAIDNHLDGRRRVALGALVAAGLLRPEVWPFLFLYALWLAWPRTWRWRVAAACLGIAVPLSWFMIDVVGAHQFFRSASAATHQSQGGPLLSREPGLATIRETWQLISPVVVTLFLLAVAVAIVRWWRTGRAGPTIWFSAGAVSWLLVDAVLAQGHFATGASRYLLPGAALACVVVGIFVADAVRWVAGALHGRRGAAVATVAVAVVVAAVLVPDMVTTARQVRQGALLGRRFERLQSTLKQAVTLGGGRAAILRCGPVSTQNFQVPMVAWQLHLHLDQVQYTVPDPADGTVIAQGTTPRIPAQVSSGYTKLGTVGSGDHAWTVFTACPPR
ncbi:MAG TPA: hypothetical protein VMH41_08525 [Mycobacteriales bacterium]|nr:hypothetical protein [Mycobacteriales bacterium]